MAEQRFASGLEGAGITTTQAQQRSSPTLLEAVFLAPDEAPITSVTDIKNLLELQKDHPEAAHLLMSQAGPGKTGEMSQRIQRTRQTYAGQDIYHALLERVAELARRAEGDAPSHTFYHSYAELHFRRELMKIQSHTEFEALPVDGQRAAVKADHFMYFLTMIVERRVDCTPALCRLFELDQSSLQAATLGKNVWDVVRAASMGLTIKSHDETELDASLASWMPRLEPEQQDPAQCEVQGPLVVAVPVATKGRSTQANTTQKARTTQTVALKQAPHVVPVATKSGATQTRAAEDKPATKVKPTSPEVSSESTHSSSDEPVSVPMRSDDTLLEVVSSLKAVKERLPTIGVKATLTTQHGRSFLCFSSPADRSRALQVLKSHLREVFVCSATIGNCRGATKDELSEILRIEHEPFWITQHGRTATVRFLSKRERRLCIKRSTRYHGKLLRVTANMPRQGGGPDIPAADQRRKRARPASSASDDAPGLPPPPAAKALATAVADALPDFEPVQLTQPDPAAKAPTPPAGLLPSPTWADRVRSSDSAEPPASQVAKPPQAQLLKKTLPCSICAQPGGSHTCTECGAKVCQKCVASPKSQARSSGSDSTKSRKGRCVACEWKAEDKAAASRAVSLQKTASKAESCVICNRSPLHIFDCNHCAKRVCRICQRDKRQRCVGCLPETVKDDDGIHLGKGHAAPKRDRQTRKEGKPGATSSSESRPRRKKPRADPSCTICQKQTSDWTCPKCHKKVCFDCHASERCVSCEEELDAVRQQRAEVKAAKPPPPEAAKPPRTLHLEEDDDEPPCMSCWNRADSRCTICSALLCELCLGSVCAKCPVRLPCQWCPASKREAVKGFHCEDCAAEAGLGAPAATLTSPFDTLPSDITLLCPSCEGVVKGYTHPVTKRTLALTCTTCKAFLHTFSKCRNDQLHCRKCAEKHNDPPFPWALPVHQESTSLDPKELDVAIDSHKGGKVEYTKGGLMSYRTMRAILDIMEPYLTHKSYHVDPFLQDFPEGLADHCLANPHTHYFMAANPKSPDHFFTLHWKGPYHNGKQLAYAENLGRLVDRPQSLSIVTTLKCAFGSTVEHFPSNQYGAEAFGGVGNTCAFAHLSNVFDYGWKASFTRPTGSIRPMDCADETTLHRRMEELTGRRKDGTIIQPTAAAAPSVAPAAAPAAKPKRDMKAAASTAPPRPSASDDEPKAAPPPRWHRNPKEKIEKPPSGFPAGSLRLRRTPMTQEVCNQFSDERLRQLLKLDLMTLPSSKTVLRGIQLAQRSRHLYAILLKIPDLDRSITLPRALIMSLELMQKQRKWESEATVLNQAHVLYGALHRLDQYTNLEPIDLDTSSEWNDAMKAWTKDAIQHLPQVTEATAEAVSQICREMEVPDMLVCLTNWYHASRTGNIYTVKLHEVDFEDDPGTGGMKWRILWTRAKTASKVGPYTTHSWISMEHYRTFRSYIDARKKSGHTWLFPSKDRVKTTTRLRNALRTQNKRWDLRSMRRGALCALARNGTPLETVLMFSGHKNLPMLLRYLRYGLISGERATKGAEAARSALPPRK